MKTLIIVLLALSSSVAFGQCGAAGTLIFNPISQQFDCTGSSSGTGTVTSVGLAGTANQITVTGATPITTSGSWTLSIPTNPTLPGNTTGTFIGNITGNVTGNTSGTAGSLPTTSLLGGVTLSGLTGPIYFTAGVPRIATGTCNSTTFVAGDGTCAAISTAFSVLTSATNSQAAMVVGTGASLAVSGSGTIAATTVTGFSPAAGKVLTLSGSMTQTVTDSSTVAFGAGGTVLYGTTSFTGGWAGSVGGNTITASTTQYWGPSAVSVSSSRGTRDWSTPAAGTVKGLQIVTDTTQSANNSMVCSVYINGTVAGAITFTIAAGTVAGAFSDTTHTISVSQFDRIAIGCLNNANVSSAGIEAWSLGFSPSL